MDCVDVLEFEKFAGLHEKFLSKCFYITHLSPPKSLTSPRFLFMAYFWVLEAFHVLVLFNFYRFPYFSSWGHLTDRLKLVRTWVWIIWIGLFCSLVLFFSWWTIDFRWEMEGVGTLSDFWGKKSLKKKTENRKQRLLIWSGECMYWCLSYYWRKVIVFSWIKTWKLTIHCGLQSLLHVIRYQIICYNSVLLKSISHFAIMPSKTSISL